ncbi:hypothetical protein GCM10011352_29580 [Marinobacterium zhoushanense]|uniref:Nudix hydrolase domain-containing protein n=1 Tax=Marinobacterium zhoushanense TaxID=1679163 RepID=A0ABQ1KLK0_9GAMM|nr:hypothetical protein GCM10011352_29580 [Marinobacterium zhoushanense]
MLVIKRAEQVLGAGFWSPPAGKVESNEDQVEAVIREVAEEVGLTVRPLRCVWQCEADGVGTGYQLYWWLAEVVSGELYLASSEVAEVQWLEPEAFSGLSPTFPKGRQFFDLILPSLPEWERVRSLHR